MVTRRREKGRRSRLAAEGRGFSPAPEIRRLLGALAPEAALPQGLKAPRSLLCVPAGLKPCPSRTPNNCAYEHN